MGIITVREHEFHSDCFDGSGNEKMVYLQCRYLELIGQISPAKHFPLAKKARLSFQTKISLTIVVGNDYIECLTLDK